MPQDLDQATAPPSKHEQMAAVRIVFEYLLHHERQAIKTLAHVSVTSRQPNPRASRKRDHRRRLLFASAVMSAATAEGSTAPVIRIRLPSANSISTVEPTLSGVGVGDGSAASDAGAIATGLKGAGG